MVNIDENFLLYEGVRKAKKKGLEIHLGEETVLSLDNPRGKIHLPMHTEGVDARGIIALVADDYPKTTRRYLYNKRKLPVRGRISSKI